MSGKTSRSNGYARGRRLLLAASLAAGALGMQASSAQATLRIAGFAQTQTPADIINSQYTYTYTIDFTGPAMLSASATANDSWAPDFLEVFDFAGYVLGSVGFTPAVGAGSLANNNFTASRVIGQDTAAETALLPASLGTDSVAIDNLKIEYADIGASNPGLAPLLVGYLSAKSTLGTVANDWYLSTETLDPDFSGVNHSGTSVPVPEPSAVVFTLCALGLARAGLRRRH